MSGACFPSGPEAALTSKTCGKDLMDSNHAKQTDKLLEYEHMVSSAENKCTLLKGQLEKIKQLYANQTELVKQATNASSGAGDKPTARTAAETIPIQSSRLVRQTSHAIGTEDTGASLGTINNILTGITKSIQMTDFLDQLKDLNEKTSHKVSRISDDDRISVRGVEGVKISTRSKQALNVRSKSRVKGKTSRTKVTPKVSSAIMKKIKIPPVKLPEKRMRTSETALTRPYNFVKENKKSNSSRAVRKPRYPAKPIPPQGMQKSCNSDLVELYHNIAVKESKSSDSDVPKKQSVIRKDDEINEVNIHVVPPLNINDHDTRTVGTKSLTSAVSRNYEMPTISWKMKNVAKYYMNSFNIKSIPFVPATSVGPSHNIGINIQQVMSMVKTKQPVQKLSPTLAYNIGLAAGRWENHPLSFLSSLASKVYSQCPLSKTPSLHYHHLQEVAKTIPQEIIEEADEDDEDEQISPGTQSMIITGPSGDVKVTNRKQTVWTMDPNEEKKCTCIPEKGIEFQQIINKFNGSVSKSRMSKPPTDRLLKSNKTPAARHVASKGHSVSLHEAKTVASNDMIPLQNKENKLKEVLAKLHDDFDAMTKTYDELSKKAEEDKSNMELIKKLESLDKDLNSKEEEIVMVMTLYKEVLALKQQVKTLKERTVSKENISLKPHHQMRFSASQYSSGGNNTAAGLLSKLLKQIQHFQTHYKRN